MWPNSRALMLLLSGNDFSPRNFQWNSLCFAKRKSQLFHYKSIRNRQRPSKVFLRSQTRVFKKFVQLRKKYWCWISKIEWRFLRDGVKYFLQCWLLKLIGNIPSILYMGGQEQVGFFFCLFFASSSFSSLFPVIVILSLSHRKWTF